MESVKYMNKMIGTIYKKSWYYISLYLKFLIHLGKIKNWKCFDGNKLVVMLNVYVHIYVN